VSASSASCSDMKWQAQLLILCRTWLCYLFVLPIFYYYSEDEITLHEQSIEELIEGMHYTCHTFILHTLQSSNVYTSKCDYYGFMHLQLQPRCCNNQMFR
jgi:hypothetical protein